jgi:hypothetical protein
MKATGKFTDQGALTLGGNQHVHPVKSCGVEIGCGAITVRGSNQQESRRHLAVL